LPGNDPSKPVLRAVILDFSSVNNVDVTSVQELIDVRNQLDRYAAPEVVQWHFAGISNRWTKRALAAAGFGYLTPPGDNEHHGIHQVKSIFSVAEIGGADSAAHAAELNELAKSGDLESAQPQQGDGIRDQLRQSKLAAVHGVNLPLFHVDIVSALKSALFHTELREHTEQKIRNVEADGSQASDPEAVSYKPT
jgi:solute carrier family 26 (sodium-independent sulfate anion transporter), member 11